jgi:Na+(H+)/acetate symporter ActP
MLISIVQFYFKEDDLAVEYRDHEHYIGNYGVYLWKLRGGFGMSAIGIAIYLLIIVAHFDTVCFPNVWASFFQDGSIKERNLILFLILFWIGTLYLCTSALSVGNVQANVYFVSW